MIWTPQPGPQEAAARTAGFIDELLFGGSRGGGKSDYLLGDFAAGVAQYGSAWRGILFRRTFPELEELILRGNEMFRPMGATYNAGNHTFHWPNGAFLRLRYLKRPLDYQQYQGHQYTWIGWDELQLQANLDGYHLLKACLRSPHDVPEKRIRATANPGGPSHNAVKAYFIDPAPGGGKTVRDPETDFVRMYIRSLVWDNRALLGKDPTYVNRIKEIARARGGDQLVKAWLYGLWDLVYGGMFDVWERDIHVLPPIVEVPSSWRVNRSFDWGSSTPFSVGWWAESDGTGEVNGFTPPRGSLLRIAEWYGWTGQPDEGLGLFAHEIAQGIKEREGRASWGARTEPGPADTQIWNADRGVSIADEMQRHGVRWTQADKRPGSRATRWERLRTLLGSAKTLDGPGLWITESCPQFERTVPSLVRDDLKPDDIADGQEDHVADETGYRVQERSASITRAKLKGY